jgi:hypothetical protein
MSLLVGGLSEEERYAIADRWANYHFGGKAGVEIVQQLRDDYKAANPEFGEYITYQRAVYGYQGEPGGVKKFRTDMANVNPNFRLEMGEERQRLTEDGVTGAALETALDDWATGQSAFFAMMGRPWRVGDEPRDVYDADNDPMANPTVAQMFAPPPAEEKEEGGSSSSGSGTYEEPTEPKWFKRDGNWVIKLPDGTELVEGSAGYYQFTMREDIEEFNQNNQLNEKKYPDQWNVQTAQWEDWVPYGSIYSSTYPTSSPLMKEYESWIARQPYGANTSIQAFVDWLVQVSA